MKCFYCVNTDTRVLDSRDTEDGKSIRRRRECSQCGKRFTTYERVEEITLRVVKSGGLREEFNKEKIISGLSIACRKRTVSTEKLEEIANAIENEILSMGKREVDSGFIGKLVMGKLKSVDEVAYIRFASVYKKFKCIDEFREELEKI
ncbi:MAG: transcriptional regulator NrdR [Candidatus Muiribacteriota bacterium]